MAMEGEILGFTLKDRRQVGKGKNEDPRRSIESH